MTEFDPAPARIGFDRVVGFLGQDKSEVLVVADQSIRNSVNPEPRIDRGRVTITMDHLDNGWPASKVDMFARVVASSIAAILVAAWFGSQVSPA